MLTLFLSLLGMFQFTFSPTWIFFAALAQPAHRELQLAQRGVGSSLRAAALNVMEQG
jgi:hypothetical protein